MRVLHILEERENTIVIDLFQKIKKKLFKLQYHHTKHLIISFFFSVLTDSPVVHYAQVDVLLQIVSYSLFLLHCMIIFLRCMIQAVRVNCVIFTVWSTPRARMVHTMIQNCWYIIVEVTVFENIYFYFFFSNL